jgi:hypothetical protein
MVDPIALRLTAQLLLRRLFIAPFFDLHLGVLNSWIPQKEMRVSMRSHGLMTLDELRVLPIFGHLHFCAYVNAAYEHESTTVSFCNRQAA